MIKDVMKTIGDLKELDLVKWGNERIGTKEPKIKNLKVFFFFLLSFRTQILKILFSFLIYYQQLTLN